MQAPWWSSKTKTCRSAVYVYFNVNFNVFFKMKKFICWWVNSTNTVLYWVLEIATLCRSTYVCSLLFCLVWFNLIKLLQWCLQHIAEHFASVLLMCTGFFFVHILFQKSSETYLVVSDLGIVRKQVSTNTVILKEFTHH